MARKENPDAGSCKDTSCFPFFSEQSGFECFRLLVTFPHRDQYTMRTSPHVFSQHRAAFMFLSFFCFTRQNNMYYITLGCVSVLH